MTETPSYGTEKQTRLIGVLAKQAGMTGIDAALDRIGLQPGQGLDTKQASEAITRLQQLLPSANSASPAPKRKFASAKQLRRLVESGRPIPADADEDTRWVLTRLLQLRAVEEALGRGRGVNRGGPIEMDTLVAFFGGWDRLAEVFEITVPTAKAWGAHLPSAHAFRAEVLTDGFVKAPR